METLIDNLPSFSFNVEMRGFHIYRKFVGQPISFAKVKEPENLHGDFAVAIKAKCTGFMFPITVGHTSIEFSRYVFFAFSGKVERNRPVRSPLVQGGLEILCKVPVM